MAGHWPVNLLGQRQIIDYLLLRAIRGGSQDPVHRMSHRISPGRPHIGPLALLGRRAPEVPQAQEAHDPSGGEDRAGQEQGELKTPEKGGHRQVECMLACGRGGEVDLTARDVGPSLGCPLLLGPGERSGLVVPVGQGHAGADGSQDGQPGRGADLAAGVEQA